MLLLIVGTAFAFALPDAEQKTQSLQADSRSKSGTLASDSAKLAKSPASKPKQTATPLNRKAKVYRFTLNEEIFPSAWRKVRLAIEDAEKWEADYIVLQLNTYGGAVDMADSIRTRLLKTKPTTIVYIDNNAASAGALISIACDSIFMSDAAQMGAATVVGQTGEQMPDKYQSYMRAVMRATATKQGRDPRIAEAMVDDRIRIPGIVDSAKVLTFTSNEAVKHNYCEGIFNSAQRVIDHIAPQGAEVKEYSEAWTEGIFRFLLNPMVSGILMMIMFMGIYSEIQTPGVGFPILAAIIAACLYFAPNYLDGLAQYWEILLFIAGLVLLAVEVLILPGMGIAGVLGLAAVVGGLTLSLVRNDFFDFTLTSKTEVTSAMSTVVISMLGFGILAVIFGARMVKSPWFQRLVLNETQKADEGYTVVTSTVEHLVGETGTAYTDLKISGRVEINGERYEAITTGEFVERGEPIKVKSVTSNLLVVTPVPKLEGEA